jgi:hypothetical protein
MNNELKHKRIREIIAGLSLIVAYGVLGSLFTESKTAILGLEFISGLAVILAALMLYPQLAARESKMAGWFIAPRILEGLTLCFAAFLTLPSAPVYQRIHGLVYAIHSYVFVLTGLLFYLILYRSRLLPRFISLWGLVALALLLAANIFEHAGHPLSFGMLFFLPIVLNEVFLAGWLILKGLKPSPLRPGSRGGIE